MSSKSPARSCEDVDETALSYAEIKALCAGNPLIAEKMNLDVDVTKLRVLKAEHQSLHYRLEDALLQEYPGQIADLKERIIGIDKDIKRFEKFSGKAVDIQTGEGGSVSVSQNFPGMYINGVEYTEKEPAAKALRGACQAMDNDKVIKSIGSYMDFSMSIQLDSVFFKTAKLYLRGAMTYQVELGTDAFGNMTRINNALHDLPKKLEGAKQKLENIYEQQEAAKVEIEKPFALADELAEKEARLALLNAELNIDGDGGLDVEDDKEPEDREQQKPNPVEAGFDSGRRISAKSTNPTFIDAIRSYKAEHKPSVPGKKSSEHDI